MEEEKNPITQGTIWKQVLIFFFPIMIGGFFQQLYTMVDAIVVGRGLGTVELAAVGGSATKLINTVTNFFIGVSIGITAYTARSFGEGNFSKLREIVFHGLVLFLAMGTVMSGLAYHFSYDFLIWMDTPADSVALSNTYLRTYLAGILFCVFYNLMAGILHAMGDAKRPLYVLIFCCILNIVLDILLALVLHWGVFGVALATVISQFVSALLLGGIYLKQVKKVEKLPRKFNPILTKEIAYLGIPTGIHSMIGSFTNMLVQATVNSFDTVTVAAWGTFLKLDGAIDLILVSLSGTVVTFVGQNLGAKNLTRVKQAVNETLMLGFVIMPLITGFFLWNRTSVLSLFTEDPQVVAIGSTILFAAFPMYVCAVPLYVLSQAVRGMGHSIAPMVLGLFGSVILRLTWIYVVFPLRPTIVTLGLSFPVIALSMSILFIFYYRMKMKQLELAENQVKRM